MVVHTTFCILAVHAPCRVTLRRVAQGLVLMMLHQVTMMNVVPLGHTRILRTDFFDITSLVLHVPSST